jgi:tRNA pseudouridine55 synthase
MSEIFKRAILPPPPAAGENQAKREEGSTRALYRGGSLPNPSPQAGEGTAGVVAGVIDPLAEVSHGESPVSLSPSQTEEGRGQRGRRPQKPKRFKRDVDGWVVLDKPVGMTSTHAVAVVKRAFAAKKAGHAGTLDPLASGILPIALGEATKTVPFVMDGRKAYRFTVRWGVETDTDDSEGRGIAASDERPSPEAIRAALPAFTGVILQTPPKYSAIKIAGERAYDLARAGEDVVIEPRQVEISRLELVGVADPDHAEFEAECGKGTYVRAIARDLGRALGVFGHVVALRRTAVGPFSEADAACVEALPQPSENPAAPPAAIDTSALRPVAAGLALVPSLNVSRADAGRLSRGQSVLLRGRDAPIMGGWMAVSVEGQLMALAEVVEGELCPRRIFHSGGRSDAPQRR